MTAKEGADAPEGPADAAEQHESGDLAGTGAPAEPGDAAGSSKPSGILDVLRDRFCRFDRRMLGIFRLCFGSLLLVDLVRRVPDATFFYSNEGVLSNHLALFAPLGKPYFSLFSAFSTPAEVKLAMFGTAVAYAFYLVGYRTKVFRILAFVLFTSLNARNIFLENGGCVVMALLAGWTMFLPLGDRFSVDAVLRSLRARDDRTVAALNDRADIEPDRTPFHSIVGVGIVIEVAAIYFFNAVHKLGATWRDGEAIHWVLWQNRIATTWAGWLRMHEPSWLSPVFTKLTVWVEGIMALLAVSPVFQRQARVALFALAVVLHLGIALFLTLGPFSYAMIALTMLLLPQSVFDAGAAWLGRRRVACEVVYDGSDPGLHLVARVLARLDVFQAIAFTDSRDAAAPTDRPSASFAARRDVGSWMVGSAAIVLAMRSLPAGGLLGGLLGNAAGAALLRAVLRRREHLAEVFLLAPAAAPGSLPAYVVADPAPPWREQLDGTLSAVRESSATILLAAVCFQIGHDNWWIPRGMRPEVPRVLQPVTAYPRFIRGWAMFAPDAPKEDGTLVVDGVTADGRHLDPLTGKEPDLEAPLHGPWLQSQLQCDYFLKIRSRRTGGTGTSSRSTSPIGTSWSDGLSPTGSSRSRSTGSAMTLRRPGRPW